jgi:hypothetical protein
MITNLYFSLFLQAWGPSLRTNPPVGPLRVCRSFVWREGEGARTYRVHVSHLSAAAAPGLALFSSSVSNRLATAQTFTVFLKGLQNRPDNRAALEKKLYVCWLPWILLLLAVGDARAVTYPAGHALT